MFPRNFDHLPCSPAFPYSNQIPDSSGGLLSVRTSSGPLLLVCNLFFSLLNIPAHVSDRIFIFPSLSLLLLLRLFVPPIRPLHHFTGILIRLFDNLFPLLAEGFFQP